MYVLQGSKVGSILTIIDVFAQPLCSTNTYLTLIKDLVWKCSDLDIPEDGPCPEDVMATTAMASPLPTMGTMATTRKMRNRIAKLLF